MPFTDVHRLRMNLGEAIPADGSEADTMFTDAQLTDMLSGVGGSQAQAALMGWRAKAAEYSNLVDVSEGNSQRSMSDLYKNALQQVAYWQKEADKEGETDDSEGRRGRVIIGEISRSARYGPW